MAVDFCLRLVCGLLFAILPLKASQLNPRFYRIHFLTALGIGMAGGIFAFRDGLEHGTWFWLALLAGLLFCFLGSLLWSLEGGPGKAAVLLLALAALMGALLLYSRESERSAAMAQLDACSSAWVLGGSMTAMLLGHSYLIAPSMSVTPLLTVLRILLAGLLARTALAGTLLGFWTRGHALANLNEVNLLLAMRWGLGLLLPLILTLMTVQTAKIRSTQSATGILYVVVVFCFIGELVSQILSRMTGAMLS
jgi:hypothetical protein